MTLEQASCQGVRRVGRVASLRDKFECADANLPAIMCNGIGVYGIVHAIVMSRSDDHDSLAERYHASIRAYTAAIKTMEHARSGEFHQAQRVADESRLEFQRLRNELRDELEAQPSEGSEAD